VNVFLRAQSAPLIVAGDTNTDGNLGQNQACLVHLTPIAMPRYSAHLQVRTRVSSGGSHSNLLSALLDTV
jgi:hypothetical protein